MKPSSHQADLKSRVKALILKRESRHTTERAAARREIDALGPDAVPVILDLYTVNVRRWLIRSGIYLFAVIGGGALSIPAVIATRALGASGHPFAASMIGGVLGGSITLIASFGWVLMIPTRLQRALARQISQVRDKRAVSALARALQRSPEPSVPADAAEALLYALPQLGSQDGGLLDREARRLLINKAIRANPKRDSELAVQIILALGRVGADDARADLERMSRRRVGSPEQARVRDAAVCALEMLNGGTAGVMASESYPEVEADGPSTGVRDGGIEALAGAQHQEALTQ